MKKKHYNRQLFKNQKAIRGNQIGTNQNDVVWTSKWYII